MRERQGHARLLRAMPQPVVEPAPAIEPRTYTIPEAAALLGISESHAYRTAKRTGYLDRVPVIRIGSSVHVSRAALDRLLAGDDVEAAG